MSKKAFTLIELLIVIAIICILIAIIFPFFLAAKKNSIKAVCASNLKQLGTAFTLYAADWENYYPAPGGLIGDLSYWSQSGNGGLESYVNQRGVKSVWCCPLQKNWDGKYPARTYTMNSYLRTPADIEYPTCKSLLCGINENDIIEPDETILLFEGNPLAHGYENTQYYYIYRCANWTWVKGYSDVNAYANDPGNPWHNAVNNYLYCDGHVKARPPGKRIPDTSRAPKNEMRQWYVDKEGFEVKYKDMPD